jgi:hypothetical protein
MKSLTPRGNACPSPPASRASVRPIPEELSDEMSAGDIIHALQHLGFVGGQGLIRGSWPPQKRAPASFSGAASGILEQTEFLL